MSITFFKIYAAIITIIVLALIVDVIMFLSNLN
jgi:hypothetical protein